jgi:molybdopterin-guanine dinucleotide biosynthesis protein A
VTRAGAPLEAGVVLCGGASRRMGFDKAGVVLGGETLLARAVGVLDALAPRVLLACGREPRYAELGRELVLDRRPDGGPLAGLEAALELLAASGGGWLGVLACDMPRAEPELLALCAARGRERDLDAVFFEDEAGLEPLLGVVHTRALPAVRAALERGERRCIAFHPDVRVAALRASELPLHLRSRGVARNLNTPAELDREREGAA